MLYIHAIALGYATSTMNLNNAKDELVEHEQRRRVVPVASLVVEGLCLMAVCWLLVGWFA